jgi:hypothetical protein
MYDSSYPYMVLSRYYYDSTNIWHYGVQFPTFGSYYDIASMDYLDGGSNPSHVATCSEQTGSSYNLLLVALITLTSQSPSSSEFYSVNLSDN